MAYKFKYDGLLRLAVIGFSPLFLLTSCASDINKTTFISSRMETAKRIGESGHLFRQDFQTTSFRLASWRKLDYRISDIHLYIEGDGFAWVDRRTPSLNPTPKRPIALTLASLDTHANVVYIARPCQFVPLKDDKYTCADDYWRGKRFSREVIESYNDALNILIDEYKKQNGQPPKIHLIGYSGGANISGLLASQRGDIASLRTVAGNVDNDFFTQFHHVSPMPYSLNMADEADKLSHIPQYHFIAEDDATVPLDIYKNYSSKLSTLSPTCSNYKVVGDTTHTDGWDKTWNNLLSIPVTCE